MSKQEHLKELHKNLQDFSSDRMLEVVRCWREWSANENVEVVEHEFVASLELAAKVAKECSQAEFLDAIQADELPPISLSEAELDLLQGGAKRTPLATILTSTPMQIFSGRSLWGNN